VNALAAASAAHRLLQLRGTHHEADEKQE